MKKTISALLLAFGLLQAQTPYVRLQEKPPAEATPAGFVDLFINGSGDLSMRKSDGSTPYLQPGGSSSIADISGLQAALNLKREYPVQMHPFGNRLKYLETFKKPYVLNATSDAAVNCYPGPGQIKLARSDSSLGRFQSANGRGLLYSKSMDATGAGICISSNGSTGITPAAGMAMVVEGVFNDADGGSFGNMVFGFNGVNTSGSYTNYSAMAQIIGLSGSLNFTMPDQSSTASSTAFRGQNNVPLKAGDRYAVAVWLKGLNEFQYFVQTDSLRPIGCGVGQNWFPYGSNRPITQKVRVKYTGTVTSNGNLTFTLTIPGMTGSPKTLVVPVTTGMDRLQVAAAAKTVFDADVNIAAGWNVNAIIERDRGFVELVAKTVANNITGCSLDLTNGLGITKDASSDLTSTSDIATLAGTVYPIVVRQGGGFAELSSVAVYDTWHPGRDCALFSYSHQNNGTHIPMFGRDPVTGLMVLGWQEARDHFGTNVVLKIASRAANGVWNDISASIGTDGTYSISPGPFFADGNKLYWFYDRGWTNGAYVGETGRQLWRCEVAVDPVTGNVTLSNHVLSDNVEALNFGDVVKMASGRIVRSYHDPDVKPWIAYSDDNMVTWAHVKLSDTAWYGAEGSLLLETDGALGCWMRANVGSITYSRSTDGATWTAPAAIPNIRQYSNGSRVKTARGADGGAWLIGNEDTNPLGPTGRDALTVWPIGDNGKVLGNPIRIYRSLYDAEILQYPAIIADGDDFVMAVSHQPGGGVGLATSIKVFRLSLPKSPLPITAGGTGDASWESGSSLGNVGDLSFYTSYGLALDASKSSRFRIRQNGNYTIPAPTNPRPFQEITLIVAQASSGSTYTCAFDAAWDLNGMTPTFSSTLGAVSIAKAIYLPSTDKWRLMSFVAAP